MAVTPERIPIEIGMRSGFLLSPDRAIFRPSE
jgi:hypothetical protein